MTEQTTFERLAGTNVNEHIEDKKAGGTSLKYLSWAWAWKYFKQAIPDAKYEIRHWDDKPYLFDEKTGYLVETSITAGGETHTMWLPVMDSSNHAMKDKVYTIKTKYNSFDVLPASMFDINKTIMRCLVKNMAMFGLGLYIYAGEDLPQDEEPQDEDIDSIVNDSVPYSEPKYLTVDEFADAVDKCKTINELQTLLNSQRGNPHITTMAMMATARKEAIKEAGNVDL